MFMSNIVETMKRFMENYCHFMLSFRELPGNNGCIAMRRRISLQATDQEDFSAQAGIGLDRQL